MTSKDRLTLYQDQGVQLLLGRFVKGKLLDSCPALISARLLGIPKWRKLLMAIRPPRSNWLRNFGTWEYSNASSMKKSSFVRVACPQMSAMITSAPIAIQLTLNVRLSSSTQPVEQ